MPIGPNGERLPYPGDPGYMGPGPDLPPLVPPGAGADRIAAGMNGGPPMAGPEMGGQADRLSQLLEARQMIDQEIAAMVGGPPGAENLDMLPPPPMMPPEAMMAQGGPPMPPQGPPMPPMGPQGLLGM